MLGRLESPSVSGVRHPLGLTLLAFVVAISTVGCSAVVSSSSAPQISFVSPKGVAAGSPSFTLNVVGSNLSPNSAVFFKGIARETQLISETQLTASILGTDVEQPGTAEVVVAEGEPRHGFIRSNVMAFEITPPSSSLQISTNSLPGGVVRRGYSANIAVSGGIPAHRWSISSGQLPSGLTLSAVNGVISGAPVEAGQFSFTVQVTDSSSPTPKTASKRLSLSIGAEGLALVVNTATLPDGTLQFPYVTTLVAAGGVQPYSWSITSGSLPPGLTLSASTGSIAGAPIQAGAYSFTVQVRDSSAPSQSATKALRLTIGGSGSQLQITNNGLPSGTVAVGYSATLAATGGVPPYRWSVSGGQLAPGLALQASTGQISGTPTQAGAFSVLIQVRDSSGQTASSGFNINISPTQVIPPPTISTVAPNSGSTSGGSSVLVTGANFQTGATVLFGNVPGTGASVLDASQIQVTTPPHAAGSVEVTVRNPDGQSSTLGAGFVYNTASPTLTSISPNSGSTEGGTSVRIAGTNFLIGALVFFGSLPAPTATVDSATEIHTITPVNGEGTVDVSVRNPDGQSGLLAGGFTYTSGDPPAGAHSLLAGKTPANFTVPSGWTLVATQDFEGAIPESQYIVGSGGVSTVNPHSGAKSLSTTYSFDGADVHWGLLQGNVGSFSELYLSYYDYLEPQGRHNDEMFIAHFIKRFSGDGFQEVIADWFYGGGGYNTRNGNLVGVSQFTQPGGTVNGIWGDSNNLNYGSWRQYEVHFKPNAPGRSDGLLRVYINGQLFYDKGNLNLVGTVDMSNLAIEAGGVYTKSTWRNPDGSCSPGIGIGTEAAPGCANFNNCPCPPNPPTFKRYLDDIILLKR